MTSTASTPLSRLSEKRWPRIGGPTWKQFARTRTVNRPVLMLFYLCLMLMAGLAVNRMICRPGQPNGLTFLSLLFFACATSPLRVHLPGVDRSVSLSLTFRFTAITDLPAGYGFFVLAIAVLYDALIDKERTTSWQDIGFNLLSAAICTASTNSIYMHLDRDLGLQPLLSRGMAALAYFAVASATSAIRIGLMDGVAPQRVWNEKFFWTAPLYLLAPVPGELARMLQGTYRISDRLLAVGLALIGYRYAKMYFGRLHDQRDHAQRLDEIRDRTIESLAVAIEMKDGCTAGHVQRVKRYSALLAWKLGFSEDEIRTLELAAVLHDVGKVGVPDYILGKPSRLTDYEFGQMAVHTTLGSEIVGAIQFPYPVEDVVLSHHEHWDGSGYPRQLVGTQIPRLARVLTVVDCFDALVSDRPYRTALPVEKAVEIMQQQRGKIFDPEFLDAFLEELPAVTKDLGRELEIERAHLRLRRKPTFKVKQTWLNDADANEATLRRRTIEKLASSPEQLVLLYEILQVLGADLEVEESLQKVLSMFQRLVAHDKSGIFLLREESYVLLEGRGFRDHSLSHMTIPAGHGVVAHAATSRQPIVADGPPGELPSGVVPRHFEDVRSTLVAPLILDERVIGAVVLCSSAPGYFQQEQAWFLGLVTAKLANTVSTAVSLQKLRLDASTDPMTRLPNARTTFERLKNEIARASRESTPLAVFFLDLDHFKPVNDSYGHGAGDRLLVATVETLKTCLRTYDVLGRMGGDEFVVIMPGIPSESISAKIENLKRAVAENLVTVSEGVQVATTVSMGAASYPLDALDAEELISLSDQRMYADKKNATGGTGRSLEEDHPDGSGQVKVVMLHPQNGSTADQQNHRIQGENDLAALVLTKEKLL
ncbi:MAG TPA: diguanylate cyclase [Terriglobales bacterium]|nr:diguanylate cyclase [Terriglobales bacterium]